MVQTVSTAQRVRIVAIPQKAPEWSGLHKKCSNGLEYSKDLQMAAIP